MINNINYDSLYGEIYIIIIILAIIFYYLSNINKKSILILLIFAVISYGIYIYLYEISLDKDKNTKYKENTFDNDILGRKEVNEWNFYNRKFFKNNKFLKLNEKLMDIIINIRFIKKFNRSIYGDIILNANNMMKIYVYILSDRYDPSYYIQVFIDLRDNILEMLHSLILIIPEKLKHTYNLSPIVEINRTINNFTKYTDEMLNILENYARIHLKKYYIQDNSVKSYNIVKLNYYP